MADVCGVAHPRLSGIICGRAPHRNPETGKLVGECTTVAVIEWEFNDHGTLKHSGVVSRCQEPAGATQKPKARKRKPPKPSPDEGGGE